MAAIFSKWIRHGAITLSEATDLRMALRRYPIQQHSLMTLLDFAFAIASDTGQTVYDCLYVALATLLKGKTVTADRRLFDALKNGPFQDHVFWITDAHALRLRDYQASTLPTQGQGARPFLDP